VPLPVEPSNVPALRVEGVDVRFGGVHAVQAVDLEADRGSVTGLIGPNGAGKTTTFNVITGLQPPTAGRVYLDDRDVTSLRAHRRARLGLARTFQRLEVFGSLSAYDNVLVAAEIAKGWSDRGEDPKRVTEELVDRVGLREVADARVDSMPTGMARLVELARALATRPNVLLLDEPAAGGLAILLVEHDVELVMRVCTRIHVLDFGRIIAVGSPAEIQADPAVQAAYLGAAEEEVPA
jgi:branched-chain amino acid transport system ATP-binding protein